MEGQERNHKLRRHKGGGMQKWCEVLIMVHLCVALSNKLSLMGSSFHKGRVGRGDAGRGEGGEVHNSKLW